MLAALVITSTAHAGIDAVKEHEAMQTWRFGAAVPVPASGLKFSRDTATWTLQSGQVRFMEPSFGDHVTGFVFEGQGRFEMGVPDRVELGQLRRFANKPELQAIDVAFTQLVVRSSEDVIPPSKSGPYETSALAQKRHEHWLIDFGKDVDAVVTAAILNPGSSYMAATIHTADFDWLTWEYDSLRQEEIELTRWRNAYPESWVSLDRVEDRAADGRPGVAERPVVRLDHVDVKADLTKYGRTGEIGETRQRTIDGRYVVEETYTAVVDGVTALRLDLASIARDLEVTDASGARVPLIRDAIGKRSAIIANNVSSGNFTLVLPSPMKKGEARRLTFRYTLETGNYAEGDWWYPTVSGTLLGPHTARLELTVPRKQEVRAIGRRESARDDGKTETSVWLVEKPVKMITFSTADHFEEVTLDVEGVPKVIVFGPGFQFMNKSMLHNVGADVANSVQFFQTLLDDQLDAQQLYVTNIAANHGQAFEGFLHLSEYTFTGEHPGASELFRAHEVAHEWFGHKVGWKTYRDQWLSESFAEYVAMMFVQSTVKGGPKLFEEILDSYEGIVMGNLRGGFSKFNRPWLLDLSAANRSRLGPIALGYRASTAEMPGGYEIQTYHRGPLVLNMLRMMLRYKTQNDDLFVRILRDFVQEYSGKAASTADFRRVLERDAPGNWQYFFDTWIDGTAIPSYRWSYRVEPDGDAFRLTVDLKRSGVPDGSLIPVPMRLEFPDKKFGTFFIPNRQAVQTVVQKIPARPSAVIIAPDHSLLGYFNRD